MTLSRRMFLQRVLLSGASLFLLPDNLGYAENRPVAGAGSGLLRIAMLGDSHIMGERNSKLEKRLEAAVAQINALEPQADFAVYMGDAVQDGAPGQFSRFSAIISGLRPKTYFVPGEHDWYFDLGKSYREFLMKEEIPHSFEFKGYHIILLNGILQDDFWSEKGLTPEQRMNAASVLNRPPGPFRLGKEQMQWLERDLASIDRNVPVLIFLHPPLYHYYRKWNFWVEDAPEAQKLLLPFRSVTVFHGHVHQAVQNRIGSIRFYSTLSTAWPYPYPESGVPEETIKMPRPSPARFYDGLGWGEAIAGNGEIQHKDIEWTRVPPE